MNETKISVEEALKKGKLWVNIPILFIMYAPIILCCCLCFFKMLSFWWLLPSFLIGQIIGWLYWSFAITKWRIWAFSNVDDICELEKQAIMNKLIWERGNIFEKTEIRNIKERELIAGFKIKLEECSQIENQLIIK